MMMLAASRFPEEMQERWRRREGGDLVCSKCDETVVHNSRKTEEAVFFAHHGVLTVNGTFLTEAHVTALNSVRRDLIEPDVRDCEAMGSVDEPEP